VSGAPPPVLADLDEPLARAILAWHRATMTGDADAAVVAGWRVMLAVIAYGDRRVKEACG
jgi:hypothetical protein